MDLLWAKDFFLDRLIVASDGTSVGMVDDLELSEPDDMAFPVITAFLCGPAALGPRIGGRLGMWWATIGIRLRPSDSTYPNRIPLSCMEDIDASSVRLTVPAEDLPTETLHRWLRRHVISRVPGNS